MDTESERRQRFDALFATYSSDIFAYCGWRAGASDAQDAAAEVFLTAWRRLDELPQGDAALVWLYATARRVIANQRRSTRRRAAVQERLELAASTAPHAPPTDHEESLVYERSTDSAHGIARCSSCPSGRGSRRPKSHPWSVA